MKLKPKFRYFLWFVAALLLTNILILGDLLTSWSPAETRLLTYAQTAQFQQLPELVTGYIYAQVGFQPLFLRFPSVVLFIFSMGALFSLGRRLFGTRTMLLSLLALAGTLLVPNLAKLATTDLWLFTALGLGSFSIFLYLKQPVNTWRYWTWGATIAAFWVDPLAAFVWSQTLWLFLYFLHPEGKRLSGLFLYAFAPLVALQWWWGPVDTRVISWTGWGYLAQLAAWLPWLALLVGGLVDVGMKFKKREELALLLVALLLAGLAAGSLLTQLAFCLIVGKQLDLYFVKNYPYRNVVKTVGILHLLTVFCVAFVGMMWGFSQLGGPGFRAGMAIGGFYWIASFIGIIGLYSPNRRMVLTGMTLAGLLLTTTTWLQLGPIVESYRNLPQRTLQVAALNEEEAWGLGVESATMRELLLLYGRAETERVQIGLDTAATPRVWIVDSSNLGTLLEKQGTGVIDSTRLEGWSLPGKEHTLWVIKY